MHVFVNNKYYSNNELLPLQFFSELMKVPRIESKLRVFAFRITFSSQVCYQIFPFSSRALTCHLFGDYSCFIPCLKGERPEIQPQYDQQCSSGGTDGISFLLFLSLEKTQCHSWLLLQVKESAKLRQIMQTILTLGNALNQGTARGIVYLSQA